MKKCLIWDFDGVIINSLPLRDESLRYTLRNFDGNLVEELISYHKKNSGKSRFEKIKYFYENILDKPVDNTIINTHATEMSKYIKNKLTKEIIFTEVIQYIEKNYKDIDMHIVSASLDIELKYICDRMEISKYFKTINGCQNVLTTKTILVKSLIETFSYSNESILIGDSINDFEAAEANNILFCKYNFRNNNQLNKEVLELCKDTLGHLYFR